MITELKKYNRIIWAFKEGATTDPMSKHFHPISARLSFSHIFYNRK